jgi:hypothetical protein
MVTDTRGATSLVEEAAAIVEAEWIRLQQDEALWESEVADLRSEKPAPRRAAPPHVGVATIPRRRSVRPMPDDRHGWSAWQWPATPVWPTQRSPPSE